MSLLTVACYNSVLMPVCVPVGLAPCLCFPLRASRSLERSHSNMVLQNAYPPSPNMIWTHKRKWCSASLPPSPSPLRVSAAALQPRALSPGFAAVFFLRRPQWARVITVECRLLWRGLALLTGFGTGACRGSMRTSRQVVTRQRVKQCDRYYSVYSVTDDSLDILMPLSPK